MAKSIHIHLVFSCRCSFVVIIDTQIHGADSYKTSALVIIYHLFLWYKNVEIEPRLLSTMILIIALILCMALTAITITILLLRRRRRRTLLLFLRPNQPPNLIQPLKQLLRRLRRILIQNRHHSTDVFLGKSEGLPCWDRRMLVHQRHKRVDSFPESPHESPGDVMGSARGIAVECWALFGTAS